MSTKNPSSTEDKERERRRNRYKFALVKWADVANWEDYPRYAVEHKSILNMWYAIDYEIICDDQPYKVLKAMLKLLKED